MSVLQMAMGTLTVIYNHCKLKGTSLAGVFAGDRLFDCVSSTFRNLFATILADSAAFFTSASGFAVRPTRTVEQLREAGYSIALTKHDPFSIEHETVLRQALHRYVSFLSLVTRTLRLSHNEIS